VLMPATSVSQDYSILCNGAFRCQRSIVIEQNGSQILIDFPTLEILNITDMREKPARHRFLPLKSSIKDLEWSMYAYPYLTDK
jgi:hypothetical protein